MNLPETPHFSFPLLDLADFGMALYLIVAQNQPKMGKTNLNRNEAADLLADQLGITRQYVLHWFRGDFAKHPLIPEKFLQFVRLYAGKHGLEDPQAIRTLAQAGGEPYLEVLPLLEINGTPHPFTYAELAQHVARTATFGDDSLGAKVFKSVAEAVGFEKVMELYRQSFPIGPCTLNSALFRILYLTYLTLPQYLQECFRALGAVHPREKYSMVELAALWEISVEQAREKIIPALAKHFGIFEFENLEKGEYVKWPPAMQVFTAWLLAAYPDQLSHAQAYEDRLAAWLESEQAVQPKMKMGLVHLLNQIWFRYQHFNLWAYAEAKPPMSPEELLMFAPLTSRLPFLKPVEYLLLKKHENRPPWDFTLKKLSQASLVLAGLVFLFSLQVIGAQATFTEGQIPRVIYSLPWVFFSLYVVSTLSYWGVYYALGVLNTKLWAWIYGRYQ